MTDKELLQKLLEGKKMKLSPTCDSKSFIVYTNNEYIYMNNEGMLIKHNNCGIESSLWELYLNGDLTGYEWVEYKEPILDEEEKAYLSAVIKPFRERVKTIWKRRIYENSDDVIMIQLEYDLLNLPYFKQGTMYKNMEANKKYTLKELDL